MSIRLICTCGFSMSLPTKYAGEYVECTQCHALLRIPTQDEDKRLMRWVCSCGQRLKARVRSAGRAVQCPRCGAESKVPFAAVAEDFIANRFSVKVSDESTDVDPIRLEKTPDGTEAIPDDEESASAEATVLDPDDHT